MTIYFVGTGLGGLKNDGRAYGAVTPGVIGARVGGNVRLPGITLPVFGTTMGQVSVKVMWFEVMLMLVGRGEVA